MTLEEAKERDWEDRRAAYNICNSFSSRVDRYFHDRLKSCTDRRRAAIRKVSKLME